MFATTAFVKGISMYSFCDSRVKNKSNYLNNLIGNFKRCPCQFINIAWCMSFVLILLFLFWIQFAFFEQCSLTTSLPILTLNIFIFLVKLRLMQSLIIQLRILWIFILFIKYQTRWYIVRLLNFKFYKLLL